MLRCRIESIYPLVEPLSPMALPDALASGSFGFWLLDLLVAVASGADRLGTIDLPLVEPLSPMALPDAPAAASFGFRLLVLLVAVASGADRLGTIDLPFRNLHDSQGAPSWAVLILFGICKPYRIALLQWIGDANCKGIIS